jgi:hypothetical protein
MKFEVELDSGLHHTFMHKSTSNITIELKL